MKGLHPLVSVVVNVFNEEQFVEDCLDSILEQTYPSIEVVVVDDGSSDGSAGICCRYAELHPNVSCICKENGGLVAARKDGVRAATGAYITFVDGDDWLEPDWVESLVSAALQSGADVVVAGYKEDLLGATTVNRNLIPVGVYSEEAIEQSVVPRMLSFGGVSRFGIFTYVWCKLFRADVLKKVLYPVDEEIFIGEDACTLYPAILASKTIAVVDAVGYRYRQRPGSMVKVGYSPHLERKRLSRLCHYLATAFLNSEYAEVLMPQLNSFMLSQVIVRTGGLELPGFDPADFPFRNIAPGSHIGLFGAGTFGQQFYRRRVGLGAIRPDVWVDDHYREYSQHGLGVLPVDALLNRRLDCVLVAVADEAERAKACERLVGLGVREDSLRVAELSESEVEFLMERLFSGEKD